MISSTRQAAVLLLGRRRCLPPPTSSHPRSWGERRRRWAAAGLSSSSPRGVAGSGGTGCGSEDGGRPRPPATTTVVVAETSSNSSTNAGRGGGGRQAWVATAAASVAASASAAVVVVDAAGGATSLFGPEKREEEGEVAMCPSVDQYHLAGGRRLRTGRDDDEGRRRRYFSSTFGSGGSWPFFLAADVVAPDGIARGRRHHRATTGAARCESSSSNNSSSRRDGGGGGGGGDSHAAKSDSFFDMAQQWASDYASSSTLSKNEGGAAAGNEPVGGEGGPSGGKGGNTRRESASLRTPEEFLEAMGILAGRGLGSKRDGSGGSGSSSSSSSSKSNISSSSNNNNNSNDNSINSNSSDESNSNTKEPTDLRGMMQRVLFKFDEFQSSLPTTKPSAPTKEEGGGQSNSNDVRSPRIDPNDDGDGSGSGLFSELLSFANSASLFTRKTTSPSPPDIDELIRQAQSIANHVSCGSDNTSSPSSDSLSSSYSSFLSQVLYFQENAQAIQRSFLASFGPHLSDARTKDLFQSLPLAAMHYYLEHQDSIKTPSWKRRKHRFQKDVEVCKVEELNEALALSELSYADSVDEVRAGLDGMHGSGGKEGGGSEKPRWELLFCDTESRPNMPSHFLAMKKNASPYDDALHMLMVVRGTKSMSDLMTDAMMEATDYEYTDMDGHTIVGGKAHGGMVRSGRYLVERHKKLLSTLLELSGKRRLEITLVGHSLGAGAATIAAMEWNSRPFEKQGGGGGRGGRDDVKISAHAISFGCPALLSHPLSIATRGYVTSVIADADFIPRMSGATLVNLLLDVRRFDYREQAERDVEQALRELRSRFSGTPSSSPFPASPGAKSGGAGKKLPFSIDEDDIRTVMGYVHRGLEKVATTTRTTRTRTTRTTTTSSSAGESKADDRLPAGGPEREGEGEAVVAERIEPVLFPPGECIHFYRDGVGISGTYVPCDFFNEIDVARTMVEDHLISSGYRKIFLNMMRDFHKDDHFSFESKGFDT